MFSLSCHSGNQQQSGLKIPGSTCASCTSCCPSCSISMLRAERTHPPAPPDGLGPLQAPLVPPALPCLWPGAGRRSWLAGGAAPGCAAAPRTRPTPPASEALIISRILAWCQPRPPTRTAHKWRTARSSRCTHIFGQKGSVQSVLQRVVAEEGKAAGRTARRDALGGAATWRRGHRGLPRCGCFACSHPWLLD